MSFITALLIGAVGVAEHSCEKPEPTSSAAAQSTNHRVPRTTAVNREGHGAWVARIDLPLLSPYGPATLGLHLRFAVLADRPEIMSTTLCGIDFPPRRIDYRLGERAPQVRLEVPEGYFDSLGRHHHEAPATWRPSPTGMVLDVGPVTLTEGTVLDETEAFPSGAECKASFAHELGTYGLPLVPRTDAGYKMNYKNLLGHAKFSAQTIAARTEIYLHAVARSADLIEGDVDLTSLDGDSPIQSCVTSCYLFWAASNRHSPCTEDDLAYVNRWNRSWAWRTNGVARVRMHWVQGVPACVVVRNWDYAS